VGDVTVPIGHTLEFVPDVDPLSLQIGVDEALAEFSVRLLYRGEALSGVTVTLHHLDSDQEGLVRLKTDAEGRVTAPLSRSGTWLLANVQMVSDDELPEGDGIEFRAGQEPSEGHDSESLRATLTFAVN
jgi:uncharacterized GH25 family protein